MPEPGLNPRAELKEFLGSLIFVLEGGQDARPPLSNDSLEAVLASLDDRILADLLSYFQRCSGRGALLSADHPLEHCSPDADVRLTWPYQGQYCIPVDSEYRFVHPDPAGVLNRALDRFLGERLLSIVNLHLDVEATRRN